jgi:hypothetical protein
MKCSIILHAPSNKLYCGWFQMPAYFYTNSCIFRLIFLHMFWVHFPILKLYLVLQKLCCMFKLFLAVHHAVVDKTYHGYSLQTSH